jgi:hypothetical protein
MSRNPDAEDPFSWVIAAAAYSLGGDEQRAAAAVQKLRRLDPFFSPDGFVAMFRKPEDGRKVEEALAAAGLD